LYQQQPAAVTRSPPRAIKPLSRAQMFSNSVHMMSTLSCHRCHTHNKKNCQITILAKIHSQIHQNDQLSVQQRHGPERWSHGLLQDTGPEGIYMLRVYVRVREPGAVAGLCCLFTHPGSRLGHHSLVYTSVQHLTLLHLSLRV
jgi:hypothetical protein